jgi:nucleotide-binding universal stress UspA family protein
MHVLLAHDGSAGASAAEELVGAIRWPADSTIRVVGVIEPSTVVPPLPVPYFSPEADKEITEYAETGLKAAAERLATRGHRTEWAVLRGRAATVILDEAREFGADLVVVGSRGHGAIASLVLGSVSGEVVDHAPCPVLVARRASLSRVLFATDNSAPAKAAQALIQQWPMFEDIPIHVVSVADVVAPWSGGIAPTMYQLALDAYARDLKDATAEHQRIAKDTAAELRAAGRDASGEAPVGDPAGEVIAAAERLDGDVVVIGSRGRTGLKRLLLGSVARNVILGTTASVLVVHDAAAKGDR